MIGLFLVAVLGLSQLTSQPHRAQAVTYAAATNTANRVYGQPDFFTNTYPKSNNNSTLYQPFRAVLDNQDNLYLTNSVSNTVLFYPAGSVTATRTYGANGASYTFNYPRGVTRDANGLYVADSSQHRLLYFADSLPGASGPLTYTRLYGQPDAASVAPNHNKLGSDSLFDPVGMTTDSTGGLYVADNDNNRVLYFPAGSTTASRVYGQPDLITDLPNYGGVSATSLHKPSSVALDSTGGLYIADSENHRVLYFPAGNTNPTRVYGQPDFTSSVPNNGGISASSLNYPRDVVVDKADNLYVSDTYNNRVLFYPAGSITPTFVYGQSDFNSARVNNGGIGPNGFYGPAGMAVDSVGGLYVCDTFNHRVLYFPNAGLNGTLTLLSSSAWPSSPTGQSLTLTATVKSALPNAGSLPQGEVEFIENNTVLATVSLDANGLATTTLNGLSNGQHKFTAHYKGNTDYTESISGQLVQTVANSTVTLTSSANPALASVPITLTATVVGSNPALIPSGTITFTELSSNGASYGSATLTPSANGATAKLVLPNTPPAYPEGYNFVAVYSGDSNFSPNLSPVLSEQRLQSPSAITLTQSSVTSGPGQSVTFTAKITPFVVGLREVTLKDGATVLQTFSAPTTGNDTVVFTTNALAPGQHNMVAEFSGAAYYEGSTSAVLTHRVISPSATNLTNAPNPSTYGDSVTFTATVTPITATGSVMFKFDNTTPVTVSLPAGSNVATYMTSTLKAGQHPVTAAYNGDANLAPSTSRTVTQTVTAGPAASIVAVSGGGQSAAISTTFAAPLVAKVMDAGSNPVSGTNVTFTAPSSGQSGTFAGGSATYTGQTDASGRITTTAFSANGIAGSYNVTATVAGVAQPALFGLTNQAGCDPLVVTSTADDGTSCGTLRVAVATAAGGSNKQIMIELPAGSVISLTTGLTLTSGIAITTTASSGVGPNSTPPIILQGIGPNSGDGLTLAANNQLYGLWVRGFSGRQLVAPASSHTVMQCVRASKT